MLLTLGLPGLVAAVWAVAWEGIRLVNGADWSWSALASRWVVVTAALGLGLWAAFSRRRWYGSLVAASCACLLAYAWDLRHPNTHVAWLGTAGCLVVLLLLESAFALSARASPSRMRHLEYVAGLLFLAGSWGVALVVLAQVEARFSEEEFFVAVQACFLSLFCLSLLLAQVLVRRLNPSFVREAVGLRPAKTSAALALVMVPLALWGARAYQASFYSSPAPGFDGLSADTPFLCSTLPQAAGAPRIQEVAERILRLVEANPNKGVPEYGMLALVTGESRWADAFRIAIISEAEDARFTEPANSVKYGQRLAAARTYYFPRVQEAFPTLFSDDELATLRDWFAAINRRAMTVEWVDLLYGLAFSFWPRGPYENQENGAGLLALLESSGLGDQSLTAANREYLGDNVRGWAQRFRNTDDAYLYQPEWIDNALFQELYQGRGSDVAGFERNRRLAFEWLLLQSLPGGVPLTYNRPGAMSTASTLLLGALLLEDPRYIWAADQALTQLETSGGYLYAQPGLELAFAPGDGSRQAGTMDGEAPTQGSCLLFSPSGLPTQVGPLAPDKIVFRDEWEAGASYLLVNLRFTGWHRYKGTNDIVTLYQDGPIVIEESAGQSFNWLPSGRSLFRDKRIPRENLNGLLVPRTGLSQVVYALSGLNGPWAQDPPHYARVEVFSPLGFLDVSRTAIENWRGWEQQRTIYFFHQGAVIVVDAARQQSGQGKGALAWHLTGPLELTDTSLQSKADDTPFQVVLPVTGWPTTTIEQHAGEGAAPIWDVTYRSPRSGELHLVTAFLTRNWAGADYQVEEVASGARRMGQYVRVSNGDSEIRLLHNESSGTATADGLTTDGLAMIVVGVEAEAPHTICHIGGSQASLALTTSPRVLRRYVEQTVLERGRDWEWQAGVLTLRAPGSDPSCVTVDY